MRKDYKIEGLNSRHVSQIIRRKMLAKIFKDKTKYNRKDKQWKKDLK